MGTKNNPGKWDCYHKAHPDEPMFVLLGRDRAAPQLVREWMSIHQALGDTEQEKMKEAYFCALEMERWRERGEDWTEVEPYTSVIRQKGLCGLVRDKKACILPEGHKEPHG